MGGKDSKENLGLFTFILITCLQIDLKFANMKSSDELSFQKIICYSIPAAHKGNQLLHNEHVLQLRSEFAIISPYSHYFTHASLSRLHCHSGFFFFFWECKLWLYCHSLIATLLESHMNFKGYNNTLAVNYYQDRKKKPKFFHVVPISAGQIRTLNWGLGHHSWSFCTDPEFPTDSWEQEAFTAAEEIYWSSGYNWKKKESRNRENKNWAV